MSARTWFAWLLVGVALRLLMLPIAAHTDMLAVYSRMAQWRDGSVALSDFNLQALPMLLHRLFVDLLGVPLPDMSGLPWPNAEYADVYRVTAREIAAVGPGVVLLWKAPFVLADLACGVVAARIVGGTRALSVFRLWMLHPVLIYVVGYFGKYESFMLLPLLLGLLDLRRGHQGRGFVWVGVAVAMRIYPAFLVPPMVLAASADRRRRCELCLLAIGPMAVVLMACALRSYVAWLLLPVGFFLACKAYAATRRRWLEPVFWVALVGGIALLLQPTLRVLGNANYSAGPILQHGSYLLHSRLKLGGSDSVLLFGLAYGLVCLWSYRAPRSRATGARTADHDVIDAALLASLSFFGLNFFNPQYFVLLVALALVRYDRLADAGPAHALQILGLLLFLLFFAGGSVSSWLLAPLAPNEMGLLPGPLDMLPADLKDFEWPGAGRTLLLLGGGWMALEVVLRWYRERRGESVAVAARASWSLAAAFLAWPAALAAVVVAGFCQPITWKGKFEPVGTWQVVRPLDGIELRPEAGRPVAIEVRAEPIAPALTVGRHVIEVVPEGEDGAPAQTLSVRESDLAPDAMGVFRVPIRDVELAPDRTYRLRWQHREPGLIPGSEMRLVYEMKGSELARRARRSFERRFFEDSRFGWWWLGSVLACLLGAVVLGIAGRRR